MKKVSIVLSVILSTVFVIPASLAATSEVTWIDYKKYRDIHPSNESRKHFRERTFKNFEKHFTKLAESLPKGQILKIDVTNVDLAGDTHAGGISRLRIVKELYFPRMGFSYQLVTVDGSEVASGKVELKDMSFMMGSNLRHRNDSLGYEKNMLDDWFEETFNDYIVEKEK